MMRIDSWRSWTDPMCQPPRQRIETCSLVRPRRRVGMPLALSCCASARCASEAAATLLNSPEKKSRRVESACITPSLHTPVSENSPSVYTNRAAGNISSVGLLQAAPVGRRSSRLQAASGIERRFADPTMCNRGAACCAQLPRTLPTSPRHPPPAAPSPRPPVIPTCADPPQRPPGPPPHGSG